MAGASRSLNARERERGDLRETVTSEEVSKTVSLLVPTKLRNRRLRWLSLR